MEKERKEFRKKNKFENINIHETDEHGRKDKRLSSIYKLDGRIKIFILGWIVLSILISSYFPSESLLASLHAIGTGSEQSLHILFFSFFLSFFFVCFDFSLSRLILLYFIFEIALLVSCLWKLLSLFSVKLLG